MAPMRRDIAAAKLDALGQGAALARQKLLVGVAPSSGGGVPDIDERRPPTGYPPCPRDRRRQPRQATDKAGAQSHALPHGDGQALCPTASRPRICCAARASGRGPLADARARRPTPSRPSTASRRRRRSSSAASGSAATTTCAAIFGKPVADPKATQLPAGDRGVRDDGADGAGRELCGLSARRSRSARRNGSSPSAWRAGAAEAAERRELLDHVPELRPAGAALGALLLHLSLRRRRWPAS